MDSSQSCVWVHRGETNNFIAVGAGAVVVVVSAGTGRTGDPCFWFMCLGEAVTSRSSPRFYSSTLIIIAAMQRGGQRFSSCGRQRSFAVPAAPPPWEHGDQQRVRQWMDARSCSQLLGPARGDQGLVMLTVVRDVLSFSLNGAHVVDEETTGNICSAFSPHVEQTSWLLQSVLFVHSLCRAVTGCMFIVCGNPH